MIETFQELGDATSRNLEFAQRKEVSVSYGEETITETNLLEIRRRHCDRISVCMFPKAKEAKTGADWEWHIVGRRRTLKMRVQAKRLQSNDVLKVGHKVASTGKEQRDLLIEGAAADGMKPVYCIYCSEPQRTVWKQRDDQKFQTGCLLAQASDIRLTTKKLCEIEGQCFPWHQFFVSDRLVPYDPGGKMLSPPDDKGWNAPTIRDLNENTKRDFDSTGVRKTTREYPARRQPSGVHRFLMIDARDEPDFGG